MGTVIEFPRHNTSEMQPIGQDVSISLHFIRHGEKRKDGKLAKRAIGQAEFLGEKIANIHAGQAVFTEVYSGTKERVQATAQAISRGIRRCRGGDVSGPEVYPQLSHETFLLDESESAYFARVDARLEQAFDSGPLGRRQRIKQAERTNMQDWLASHKGRPDKGTASPWEVAKNVTAMVGACIDEMEYRPNGSHTDYILVTHEHVLASIVQFLLAQSRSGTFRRGKEIFDDIGRINYLEDVTITVSSKNEGDAYMYATIRGVEYAISLSDTVAAMNERVAA